MMRRLVLLLLLLSAPSALFAGSCTTPTSTNLAFGTYTGASALATTATITVNCTSGFAYTVGLYSGTNQMSNGGVSTVLNYGMYQDAAHTMIFGSNSYVVASTGTGANQTFTIYGLLSAGQNVAPAGYQDYPIVYVTSEGYSSFYPTATVPSSCTVSASSLSFGAYAGSIVYGTSSLSVNCTDTTTYNLGLNAGTSTGATVTSRAMTYAGSNTLAYQIFQTNAYSTNWGNTVGTDTVTGTGTGVTQAVNVYGRINAGLYVTPGSYSDTITVTVTY